MQEHAEKCAEREILRIAAKTSSSLQQLATACIDDHLFLAEDFVSTGELCDACVQILLKRLYFVKTWSTRFALPGVIFFKGSHQVE